MQPENRHSRAIHAAVMNTPNKKNTTANRSKNDSKNDTDRRICFDSNPDILTVASHFDYTEHERSSAWYTSSECHCFKVEYDRESSDKSVESIDFERAQRIDAVRDLLLKAQEVQRSIRDTSNKSSSGDDSGSKCNAKWGSYSRWLADFYKHHSEECGIAARHRGLENFMMANQKWCPQHHHLHHDFDHSDSDSETEATSNIRPSMAKHSPVKNGPVKRSPVKPRRWNDDDDDNDDDHDEDSLSKNSEGSDDSQPSPKSKLKQGRWSANGSSGNGSSATNGQRDVPLKPLKHNLTPPRLYNAHAA